MHSNQFKSKAYVVVGVFDALHVCANVCVMSVCAWNVDGDRKAKWSIVILEMDR